jgi:tetratricopeptide (TPR) repeat protein
LIDRGLVSIAQNDYQKGFLSFQKALSAEETVKDPLILNNMAVCCLYSGKLEEAIRIYENAIANKPKKTINEHILLNLSTLYELQSSDSKSKKIEILKLVNEHRADLYTNLDSCLKL